MAERPIGEVYVWNEMDWGNWEAPRGKGKFDIYWNRMNAKSCWEICPHLPFVPPSQVDYDWRLKFMGVKILSGHFLKYRLSHKFDGWPIGLYCSNQVKIGLESRSTSSNVVESLPNAAFVVDNFQEKMNFRAAMFDYRRIWYGRVGLQ